MLHNIRKKSKTSVLVVSIYLGFVNLDTSLDYALNCTKKHRVICQIRQWLGVTNLLQQKVYQVSFKLLYTKSGYMSAPRDWRWYKPDQSFTEEDAWPLFTNMLNNGYTYYTGSSLSQIAQFF